MSMLFHLINPVTPSTEVNIEVLKGVIGQEEAKEKLGFFAKSHCDKDPFPTLLMTGSHGLGKSFLAEKVAMSLNRRFVEINSNAYQNPSKFIENVLLKRVLGNEEVTLLLDEAHSLSEGITNILLTLLNVSGDLENSFTYKGSRFIYNMSKVNVVFSTTDAYKMFSPLINRCEEIYLYPYSDDEIAQILKLYMDPEMCLQFSDDNKRDELSMACRGRARNTYRMATRINRYCRMSKSNIFDDDSWDGMKDIFGIKPLGLDQQEFNLLRVVSENGPVSAKTLALKLMVNQKNIEEEIETRLKELDLITNTTRGRILTEKGMEYANECFV